MPGFAALLEAPVWRFTLPPRHVRQHRRARPVGCRVSTGRPVFSADLRRLSAWIGCQGFGRDAWLHGCSREAGRNALEHDLSPAEVLAGMLGSFDLAEEPARWLCRTADMVDRGRSASQSRASNAAASARAKRLLPDGDAGAESTSPRRSSRRTSGMGMSMEVAPVTTLRSFRSWAVTHPGTSGR